MAYSLSKLTGTPKQVIFANQLRNRAVDWIWEQGWHATTDSLEADCQKLPLDASWWIKGEKKCGAHESARRFLNLEFNTPAGADY